MASRTPAEDIITRYSALVAISPWRVLVHQVGHAEKVASPHVRELDPAGPEAGAGKEAEPGGRDFTLHAHADEQADGANQPDDGGRLVFVLLPENLLHQDHLRVAEALHGEDDHECQQADERRPVERPFEVLGYR